MKRQRYRMKLIAMLLILCFLAVYIFAINSFVLQKRKDFFQSCRQSRQLQRGHIVQTALSMVLLSVLLTILINSIASVITVNAEEFKTLVKGDFGIFSKAEGLGVNIYVIRQILKSFIEPAVDNAALTVLFFNYIDEQDMRSSISGDFFVEKKFSPRTTVLAWIFVATIFIGSISFLAFKYTFLMDDVGDVKAIT